MQDCIIIPLNNYVLIEIISDKDSYLIKGKIWGVPETIDDIEIDDIIIAKKNSELIPYTFYEQKFFFIDKKDIYGLIRNENQSTSIEVS